MLEHNAWPGWQAVRVIGKGSYGTVFEIRRTEFDKTYAEALKVISIPFDESDVSAAYSEGLDEASVTTYFRSVVERISREFALMSELKGFTNIVSYQDHMVIPHEVPNNFGWDILIRMELLTSLPDYCKDHALSEEDVIRIGIDICKALEVCEDKKIMHRDIKPENIFVNSHGDYKLGDFGVARTLDSDRTAGTMAGTETYMAPEIYHGKAYGKTADLYSLAMVLYRFLNNNRPPFLPEGSFVAGDKERAKERRMKGDMIPEPKNGSAMLRETILQALSFMPEYRFQSASAFRKALERCLAAGASEDEDKTRPVERQFVPPVKNEEKEPQPQKKADPVDPPKPPINEKPEPENKEEPKPRNKWIIPVAIAAAVLIVAAALLLWKLLSKKKDDKPTQSNPAVYTAESTSESETQSTTEDATTEASTTAAGTGRIVADASEIAVGEKTGLAFHVIINGEEKVYGKHEDLIWSSSDPSVAAVNVEGVVAGQKAGKAVITAEMNGVTAQTTITVKEAASQPSTTQPTETQPFSGKVEINLDNTLLLGDRIMVNLLVDGKLVSANSPDVKLSSIDNSILFVDSEGYVSAMKAGSTTLTATYRGKGAVKDIKVLDVGGDSSASITLEETHVVLSPEGEKTIRVKFEYGNETNVWIYYYSCGGINLDAEFGKRDKEGYTPITIKDLGSDVKSGELTLFLYSLDKSDSLLAKAKVAVDIS